MASRRLSSLKRMTLRIAALTLLASSQATLAWSQEKNTGVVGQRLNVTAPPSLEELRNAKPMPMPRAIETPQTLKKMNAPLPPIGKPKILPGWDPGSGKPQPKPELIEVPSLSRSGSSKTGASTQPMYPAPPGSPPANPLDYDNYGPFQRWTHFGNYLAFPRSVIGKLFFEDSQNRRYVCSATVVNRSTIITAGHCVSDGNGNYYRNFWFYPSYYKGSGSGSPHPQRGGWPGVYVRASTGWHTRMDFDRDYACIVLASSGTVHNARIGDITGWAGVAFNGRPRYLEMSFGYPQAAPFTGYHIIQVAGVVWYTADRRSGDLAFSKYMGNDMTGGSSGGPWFLNWEHRTSVYPAPYPDDSELTDPLAGNTIPFVYGVNSHKRCLNSCGTPTATSGTFFDEMGSPQFFEDPGDNDDVMDVLNDCFNNGGK